MLANGSEDTAYTIKVSDLLQGYSDVDGDNLSVLNLQATNGNLINNQDGTYTFTSNTHFNGTVQLSYQVSDGTAVVNATNSITLNAVNACTTDLANRLTFT